MILWMLSCCVHLIALWRAQASTSFRVGLPFAVNVIALKKQPLLSLKHIPTPNKLLSLKIAASRLHFKKLWGGGVHWVLFFDVLGWWVWWTEFNCCHWWRVCMAKEKATTGLVSFSSQSLVFHDCHMHQRSTPIFSFSCALEISKGEKLEYWMSRFFPILVQFFATNFPRAMFALHKDMKLINTTHFQYLSCNKRIQ